MNRRQFVQSVAGVGAAALAAAEATARADQGTLAEHRIAKIIPRRLRDRYPRHVGRNAKRGHHGRGMGYQVRTLVTDQGARGWGMSYIAQEKVERFLGARVGDLFEAETGTREEAFYLDLPLHDLAGNILGKSVAELCGSHGPKAVPIYSGMIYFDDLDPKGNPRGVPGVLANCQQDYGLGYRAFKLKIGRGHKWMAPREAGIRRDIEVTRAVREEFPDCRILVDANDGYGVADFLRYVSAVADCGLYWIEEPFRETRDDLKRLREHMARVGCTALIADGEARRDRAEEPWRWGDYSKRFVEHFFELAEAELVDVCLFDLGIVGFTRWRHAMGELKAAGVLASPHTWGWCPRSYYAAQLAGGVGNVCIAEGIPGTTKGVDYSAYKFEDGKLVLPEAPGFGLRLTA